MSAAIWHSYPMQVSAIHHFPVHIESTDIDFMGHVNNARYLNWVQEAVLSHWRRVAPADAVNAHLWVALRHQITYRKPAFLEDELCATVVLERVQGASAFYDTLIRRGEEVLAEVKSRWCCLDARTLRPTRLASAVVQLFFPDQSAPSATALTRRAPA